MVRGKGMNVAGVGLGGEGGRVDGWTQGGGGGRGKVMQFPFNTLYMLYKLLTFNF